MSAADYLLGIGLQAIEQRVRELTTSAYEKLSNIGGVTLYGPENMNDRGGILSFSIEHIHPHDIAQVAAEHGVAIRAGHHCCQPLMQQLGVSSTARASFNFYNNELDIAALTRAIHDAKEIFTSR